MISTHRLLRILLVVLCFQMLVGCALFDPNRTHKRLNPEAALPGLIERWEDAREAEVERGSRFVRSESIRYELEKLAFENPRHVPTLLACAVIAFESGDKQASINFLDDVFDVEPAHADAAILRSRLALSEGNAPYARKLLDDQVKLLPDHGELRAAHAGVAYLQGDYEAARASLASARRLGAEEWRIAYNQGLVEEAAGNRSEAARQYGICLEFKPGFGPAQSRLNGLE